MTCFLLFNILFCCGLADGGIGGFPANQITNKATNSQDCGKYIAVKEGLYTDKEGNLYFKTTDWSQGDLPVDRFIFIVYSESFGAREMKEMKAIIHADSFKSLGSSYYQDKHHIYYFKEMHDGGTMSIVDDVDYQSFEILKKTFHADAKDTLGLFYQGSRTNH